MKKYSKRIALAFVVALFIIGMATTAVIAGSGSIYDPWINAVNGEGSIRYVGQYKLKSTFHLNLDSVVTAKWQQDEPDNRYINNSGSESMSFQRGEKIVAAYVVQTFGVGGTIESGTLPSLLDACGTTLNGSRINNHNSKLWVDSRNSTTNALSGGTMLSDVTDIVRNNVCGADGYTVEEDRNVTFTLSREYSWSVSTLNGLWNGDDGIRDVDKFGNTVCGTVMNGGSVVPAHYGYTGIFGSSACGWRLWVITEREDYANNYILLMPTSFSTCHPTNYVWGMGELDYKSDASIGMTQVIDADAYIGARFFNGGELKYGTIQNIETELSIEQYKSGEYKRRDGFDTHGYPSASMGMYNHDGVCTIAEGVNRLVIKVQGSAHYDKIDSETGLPFRDIWGGYSGGYVSAELEEPIASSSMSLVAISSRRAQLNGSIMLHNTNGTGLLNNTDQLIVTLDNATGSNIKIDYIKYNGITIGADSWTTNISGNTVILRNLTAYLGTYVKNGDIIEYGITYDVNANCNLSKWTASQKLYGQFVIAGSPVSYSSYVRHTDSDNNWMAECTEANRVYAYKGTYADKIRSISLGGSPMFTPSSSDRDFDANAYVQKDYYFGSYLPISCSIETGYHFNGWETTSLVSDKTKQSSTLYLAHSGDTTTPVYDGYDAVIKANAYPNTYYIDYQKGLTDCSSDLEPATQSVLYDSNVTFSDKCQLVGRSYNIKFDPNIAGLEQSQGYKVTTADTYSGPSDTVGNLEFNTESSWHISGAENNNNTTWKAVSTTTTPPNFMKTDSGTCYATAQWLPKTIDGFNEASMTGYIFDGWYDAPVGGNKVESFTVNPATTAYNKTLYAHWHAIKYEVRYNGNGNWNNSQGSYTQVMTFDKIEALQGNKFDRTAPFTDNNITYQKGYKFIGWYCPNYTDNTLSTVSLPDIDHSVHEASVIKTYDGQKNVIDSKMNNGASARWNLSTTQNDIVDLYAIWHKKVTLTFEADSANGCGLYNGNRLMAKSYDMYNEELYHDFDISNWYGTVVSNGMNDELHKELDGVSYRFIGFGYNDFNGDKHGDNFVSSPYVGDSRDTGHVNLDVYSGSRNNSYRIHDNARLYGEWEPVLETDVWFRRTLDQVSETDLGYVTGHSTAVSSATLNKVYFRSGDYGDYIVRASGHIDDWTIQFNDSFTEIYDLARTDSRYSRYNDDTNLPEIEGTLHSLNDSLGEINTVNTQEYPLNSTYHNGTAKGFYVPLYQWDFQHDVHSTNPILQYTALIKAVNKNSYYYNNYSNGYETCYTTVVISIGDDSTGGPGDTTEPEVPDDDTATKNRLKWTLPTR